MHEVCRCAVVADTQTRLCSSSHLCPRSTHLSVVGSVRMYSLKLARLPGSGMK